jgi:hypothetical protein
VRENKIEEKMDFNGDDNIKEARGSHLGGE